MKDKLIAKITIHDAPNLSYQQIDELSKWIIKKGKDIIREQYKMSKRFSANYYAKKEEFK